MPHIHISVVEGIKSICFDTGLDPRSFARTKMSQSLIEPGYYVFPDGSSRVWKSTSVNVFDGLMRVWGSSFSGERLDLIINEIFSSRRDTLYRAAAKQTALQAVTAWIRAKLLLGETHSALSPGAAFVSCNDAETEYPKGSIFFCPDNLSQRCLFVEGAEPNYYYCPDLKGMEAVAFCAATMLYRILALTHPFPIVETVYQDMREGVFLPPKLAVPGLDGKLCSLIQAALMLPVEIKGAGKSGTDILSGMLNILMDGEGDVVTISSLYRQAKPEEKKQIEKEKNFFLTRKKITVSVSRFVKRNKPFLIVGAIFLAIAVFITASILSSRNARPTTAGMFSDAVVFIYYEAFNTLDHILMEACLMGADKTDVNAVVHLYVTDKVRQANEYRTTSSYISARAWQQQGRDLPAPNVFGVTDLFVRNVGGSERDGIVFYRADYTLWHPHEPISYNRSDELTLKRDRRRNWRITEIRRTDR